MGEGKGGPNRSIGRSQISYIFQGLEKSGALKTIKESIESCRYIPSKIGIPDIKHFLYKSKTTAQFTGSEYITPYKDEASQERLQNIYLFLQGQLHAASRTAKLIYYTGKYENVFSWVCSQPIFVLSIQARRISDIICRVDYLYFDNKRFYCF